MPSIRPYLRTRPDKNGLCEIVLIYQHEGEQTYLPIDRKIAPRYWNNKAVDKWVTPEYGDSAVTLNLILKKHKNEAEEKMNTFYLLNKRYPNRNEIKLLMNSKTADHNFFTLFDAFMFARRHEVTTGTYNNYRKTKARFEQYQKHNGTLFDFHSINHGFHTHFTNYLIKEHESQANTIGSYFRILKTFLHWAELHHNIVIDKRVMANMHILREQNFYVWLTLDEIDTLYNLDFGVHKPLLTRCRDAFVLQSLIGCRYGDMAKMVSENIVLEKDGYFLQIKTRKNEKLIRVPLAKKAVAILERYEGISVSDWLPSMQECNLQIKEICKLAGMYETVQMVRGSGDNRKEIRFQKWQLVTTHSARRSAINNLKAAGVPDHVIASITGQAIVTIQGYKHADTSDVLKAITVFDRPAPKSAEPKQRD